MVLRNAAGSSRRTPPVPAVAAAVSGTTATPISALTRAYPGAWHTMAGVAPARAGAPSTPFRGGCEGAPLVSGRPAGSDSGSLVRFPSVALPFDRLGRTLRRPRTRGVVEGVSGGALGALGLTPVTAPLLR
ncbi:hypothetical protein ACFWOY_07200 [Streptomyces sp. NPDC058423]|uniref:hypothetical protein n=1 Tax=unclassified Streptomyces TaxID=2593676 RepID=UPI003657DD4E